MWLLHRSALGVGCSIMIVQHRSFQKSKARIVNHLLLVWIAVIAGVILQPCCFADFDVNAAAGIVSIDGSPAPGGTLVVVCNYGSNFTYTTMVDGKNIPPFLKGEGRYDTGDVPELSTGDRIEISLASCPDLGSVSAILQGGHDNAGPSSYGS